MPAPFIDVTVRAAAEAGFANYDPDACLINRYRGRQTQLRQDLDEKGAWAPIRPHILSMAHTQTFGI
jgi:alkylated DNA repair protein (DNA oxidative demethylase)